MNVSTLKDDQRTPDTANWLCNGCDTAIRQGIFCELCQDQVRNHDLVTKALRPEDRRTITVGAGIVLILFGIFLYKNAASVGWLAAIFDGVPMMMISFFGLLHAINFYFKNQAAKHEPVHHIDHVQLPNGAIEITVTHNNGSTTKRTWLISPIQGDS